MTKPKTKIKEKFQQKPLPITKQQVLKIRNIVKKVDPELYHVLDNLIVSNYVLQEQYYHLTLKQRELKKHIRGIENKRTIFEGKFLERLYLEKLGAVPKGKNAKDDHIEFLEKRMRKLGIVPEVEV